MHRAVLAALSMTVVGVLTGSEAIAASPTNAPAAQLHTTTFSIANMTCPTCPITVKSAISKVHGVQSVRIDLANKTAKVDFDPRLTNVGAIAAASTNAGYPARPKG